MRNFGDEELVEEMVVFTFPALNLYVSAGQVLKERNTENFEEECFNMQSSIWGRVCRS